MTRTKGKRRIGFIDNLFDKEFICNKLIKIFLKEMSELINQEFIKFPLLEHKIYHDLSANFS